MINSEELRKKIIDSYDSQLKDIFTEDEILTILDALKPSVLTTPGYWPTITTNQDQIRYNQNNMFKAHPESEHNTVISANTLSGN